MSQLAKYKEKLRYEFDKTMSAGTAALIGWLALVSLTIILIIAAFVAATGVAPDGSGPLGFGEAAWESLMRTLDSGTMGGDSGWSFRLTMLFVTLSGIFVVSTLIGVLSAGIEGKLDVLRKGRSRVLESDHTIILNWSPSIFDIISELTIANESRKKPRIVVMANRDKVEMEDEIADKIENLRNTKIICRSGDPTDLYDLAIVNPQTSRSIIVLSPEGDDPDSQVIKTVLAITNDPRRRTGRYRIAAELRELDSRELGIAVGGDEAQLVLADDLIARIMVQSCRQSGLSAVYSELLDFDGCEIYTLEQKELAGRPFGSALMAYETSTLIGIVDKDNRVMLNPPMETVIAEGARVVVIAEDDDAISLSQIKREFNRALLSAPAPVELKAEKTLILGWNRRGPLIARELSRYVQPGSSLTIVASTPGLAERLRPMEFPEDRLSVRVISADSSSRAVLDGLDIHDYDHVLVLGYNEELAAQAADTRTLVTLLHLRKIADMAGRHISVVSEMIDVRNRELAEVSKADDFVVSNKLVSLMLSQASENEFMSAIFGSLLDENGSEIYLRPVSDYVVTGKPVDFATVVLAARSRGEVAIGYRRQREGDVDDRNLGGVTINPVKSARLVYEPQDRIVVLAAS
nr:NAD-binding protein [uncultured Gellertiella sp.]